MFATSLTGGRVHCIPVLPNLAAGGSGPADPLGRGNGCEGDIGATGWTQVCRSAALAH